MSKLINAGYVSAYGIAVKNGFEGSETQWLNSLKGQDGIGIPEVTAADNGKVLAVVDGEWAVVSLASLLNGTIFQYDSTTGTLNIVTE